jgi:glycosyltransferase involved in cell wall biosynthesis
MDKIKVLIVTTYNTECGIASFSSALKSMLDKDFVVDIAELDQDILKRAPASCGDQDIEGIIERAKNYDVVNIQCEWGVFAANPIKTILRINKLLHCSDRLILTLHTPVLFHSLSLKQIVTHIAGFKFLTLARECISSFATWIYEKAKLDVVRRASRRLGDNMHIVVHTEREKKFFSRVYNIGHVHDHPLSNMHADWVEKLQVDGVAYREELLGRFGAGKKYIGLFGFISRYKGIETAIDAMGYLGDEYILLIYGAVHPESIVTGSTIDAYLAKIVKMIDKDYVASDIDETEPKTKGLFFWRARASDKNSENVPCANKSVKSVYFMGAPDDYGFARAMSAVDICVFPYCETGQSASGPVSIAIELGKRIILSRTHTFLELKKYFTRNFEMFDIGNALQLAQMIVSPCCGYNTNLKFTKETQSAMYTKIINTLALRR